MLIKTKLWIILSIVILVVGGMSFTSYYQGNSVLTEQINKVGMLTIDTAAVEIDNYFNGLENIVENVSVNVRDIYRTSNFRISDDFLQPLMIDYTIANKTRGVADVYFGLESSGKFADGTEWDEGSEYDCRERPWYQLAVSKKRTVITDPYIDGITKQLVISIVIPTYDDESNLLGVVGIDVNLDVLVNMVNNLKVFGVGYGFLTNKDGLILAHPQKERMFRDNISIESKDVIPNSLSLVGKEMLKGKIGFGDYSIGGENRRIYYSPTVKGFYVGIVFPEKELNNILTSLTTKQLIVGGLGFLIVLGIIIPIILNLNKSIKGIISVLMKMSKLDFRKDVSNEFLLKSKGEIGQLVQNTRKMEEAISGFISSLKNEIMGVNNASQNLAALSKEFTASIDEINHSIVKVSGLTEDNSAAVQETTASIEEISSSVTLLARSSSESAHASITTKSNVENVLKEVEKIIDGILSVGELASKSIDGIQMVKNNVEEVQKFTRIIDDISKSTHLLSINAQIEAAVSGDAGKGFAVVAQEIGKLSGDTKKATKEIEEKITLLSDNTDMSMNITLDAGKVMQDIIELAKKTKEKLNNTLEQTHVLDSSIQSVASATEEQSASIQEMASTIDVVAKSVVETTNEMSLIKQSSEESLKAVMTISEESQHLSGSVVNIQKEIERFKVDD